MALLALALILLISVILAILPSVYRWERLYLGDQEVIFGLIRVLLFACASLALCALLFSITRLARLLSIPKRLIRAVLLFAQSASSEIGGWAMRRWTWGFIQTYALGLTGFPFSTISVTQEPRTINPLVYSFERLPTQVEDEILAARQSDVGFNLMRLTNLLSEAEVFWVFSIGYVERRNSSFKGGHDLRDILCLKMIRISVHIQVELPIPGATSFSSSPSGVKPNNRDRS
jgi:hypothetical protein